MNDTSGPIRELRRAEEKGRYEAELVDGSVAVLAYRFEGDRILFTHTETPEKHRNRGVAARLNRYALDDAVARGLTIVPHCPYTRSFIERNPRYREHVAEGFFDEGGAACAI